MASSRKQNKGGIAKYLILALVVAVAVIGLQVCRSLRHSTPVHEPEQQAAWIDSLLITKTPDTAEAQILHYPGFVVSFNPRHRQPNWVAWELTRDESRARTTTRRDMTFALDYRVAACPTLDDYRNSGYDRGHMCPAGDMKWSREAMEACFLLTNMCPQDHDFNNGIWANLEDRCRSWAVRDSAVIVVCGPILTDEMPRKIGQSGVSVPERFFKVVLSPYSTPMRGIGFIMPNGYVPGGMQASAVSIDEVEEATGLDFFSFLPDDVEDTVEAQCNFPLWQRR